MWFVGRKKIKCVCLTLKSQPKRYPLPKRSVKEQKIRKIKKEKKKEQPNFLIPIKTKKKKVL